MQKKNQSMYGLLRGSMASVVVAATLLSTGCASLSQQSGINAAQTPEQIVAARSLARAKAIMAKDDTVVYSFMTPAYRQRVSEERYALTHPHMFTLYSAKVDKVTCQSASSCRVEAAWVYKTNMIGQGARSIDVGKITNVLPEHWIKVDGQWWYYVKE